MTGIPVACTLSEAETVQREQTLVAALRTHVRRVSEREDGYAIELAPTDEAIAAATTLIQLERSCCPFLRFRLTVEPGGALVELALGGPPGARQFLEPWVSGLAPASDH
jgi:hypothetical protein